MELALEIAVIAILYVMLSVSIQRKIGNVKRIKEIKKEMNLKMADLKKLGNNVSKEEFATRQKEITALASESMRHQMKPTFIILPIFFLLFYVALPHLFPSDPSISVLSYTLSYGQFFVAVAFITGLLSTVLLAIYDKVSASRAEKTTIQQTQTAQ